MCCDNYSTASLCKSNCHHGLPLPSHLPRLIASPKKQWWTPHCSHPCRKASFRHTLPQSRRTWEGHPEKLAPQPVTPLSQLLEIMWTACAQRCFTCVKARACAAQWTTAAKWSTATGTWFLDTGNCLRRVRAGAPRPPARTCWQPSLECGCLELWHCEW